MCLVQVFVSVQTQHPITNGFKIRIGYAKTGKAMSDLQNSPVAK